MFITRMSARFACGLLLGWCVATARADYFTNYTGQYNWLTFYHTTISESATYWDGVTGGWGWLSAYDTPVNDKNTMDRWRQITWDRDVSLNGLRIQAFHQRTDGSIGNYNVQYSVDGSTGWTDVPTATAFSGLADYNVNFTSSVTARGLRVFFPAGTYNMGTGGHGGPGVYQMLARGTVPGGINMSDPQFDIVGTTGIPGFSPVVSIPTGARPLNEATTGNWLDNYLNADGNRAGWYPPETGNEALMLDLGPNSGHPFHIQSVSFYPGVYYHYTPNSMLLSVSFDGSGWTPLGTMNLSNGFLTLSGLDVIGRYLKLSNPTGTDYYLLQELAVSAYPMPEPGTALLLGLAAALGWRRRCRCASSRIPLTDA